MIFLTTTQNSKPRNPNPKKNFTLFGGVSEGKSPVEVAILLDLAADRVRALYRDYWELKAQIYIELGRDLLFSLIKLQKIFNDIGMGENDIRNVFELVKHNELQNLQWKVEYLRNEVDILENEKWKSTNQILKLNRMIHEFEGSLAKKRGKMADMNQETGWYDNTEGNLYPTYTEPVY